jgi:hypothetical protein
MLLGCGVLLFFVKRCGFLSKMEVMMAAWLISPFFAPYGFLSDQVTLILPLAYFSQLILAEKSPTQVKRFALLMVAANVLTLLMNYFQLEATNAGWFLFAPLMLFVVRSAWNEGPLTVPVTSTDSVAR